MKITLKHKDKKYKANLAKPIDISIPISFDSENVNCFYAPRVDASPVVAGDFVGATAVGGSVNFMNVRINPHGNGTHTECVGHIAIEKFTINNCLKKFNFITKVISVHPTELENGDMVIFKDQIQSQLEKDEVPALVIRTLPNGDFKKRQQYSGTNPAYLHQEATQYMVDAGIQHLLIDLPSVDREEDGGTLLSHKAFWQYPDTLEAGRNKCTISELIFVEDGIKDGLYLLNIQFASFELDVSPSKPVLYRLKQI